MSTSASADGQVHNLWLVICQDMKPLNSHGQAETARPRAAGIEEKHSVLPLDQSLMLMTEHDHSDIDK